MPNPTIHAALVQLHGKPVAECHALVVPTAQWGHPRCGPASVRRLLAAESDFRHFSGLGWASLGVLELTALPTIGAQRSLASRGRRAPGRRRRRDVPVSIFPHVDAFPTNTLAHAARWAADIGVPAYAIDEQTAIKVVDGSTEVVSEGQWRKFGS